VRNSMQDFGSGRSSKRVAPPTKRIRKWLAGLATRPAWLRSSKRKQNTKAAPENDPEAIRKRRSSANRVLNMLKAALNYAFDEGLVASNEAWGRRVTKFEGVDAADRRGPKVTQCMRA
jgi:hypothetical protein